MDFFKKFANHAEYEAYINGDNILLPNISICANVKGEVHYTEKPKTIKYTVSGTVENGTVDGYGIYVSGTTCTLAVTPDTGYEFKQWSDGNTTNPRTFTVTENVTLDATCETAGVGPLCFTAQQANSSVHLARHGYPSEITLEFSTNGSTWYSYTIGADISLKNVGDKVYFRNPSNTIQNFSDGDQRYYSFESYQGILACSGDVTSLLRRDGNVETLQNAYCFILLFRNFTRLVSAPVLPSLNLTSYCYYGMFSGCTNLTEAPEIPATSIANNACQSMFYDCLNLVKAPSVLPAMTLYKECYRGMFYNCPKLSEGPLLPAQSLAQGSYQGMFNGGCSSMKKITCLASNFYGTDCLTNWTNGVSSTGTFIKKAGVTWPQGTAGIPYGWTVIEQQD